MRGRTSGSRPIRELVDPKIDEQFTIELMEQAAEAQRPKFRQIRAQYRPLPLLSSSINVSEWGPNWAKNPIFRDEFAHDRLLQRRVRCEPISSAGGAERQAAFGINELLTRYSEAERTKRPKPESSIRRVIPLRGRGCSWGWWVLENMGERSYWFCT
jgi:hypothetical protein